MATARTIVRRFLDTSGDRPELVLRLSVAALVAATVVVVFNPAVHGHAAAPAVDVALDTTAAVVSGSLTVLLWMRFRERREAIALYQAAAFLALAVAYGVAVIVSLSRDGSPVAVQDPNTVQLYVFATARIEAALLLVVGGTVMVGREDPRYARSLVLVPGLVVLTIAVAGYRLDAVPDPIRLLIVGAGRDGLPAIAPLGGLVQVVTAVLFFEAALVCRTLWHRDRVILDAWIAVGLVFAGFAEIHWAAYPSGHPGQVSTADLLRLAFFVALLLGIEAEARVTLTRMRAANAELAQLRASEVERAALEERARLARELHDGLAQELWLAKLKTGQAAGLPGMPPGAAPLLHEAEAAIDYGLTEARQAVLALRDAAGADPGFREVIRRFVEDCEDRFGTRVEFTCEGELTPVAPRTQVEVLRIAQEALTNVRNHASATVVGVRLAVEGQHLTLRVVDNGRGFDPSAPRDGRFGLVSMRQRAALIGGTLEIRSRPGRGTTVVVSAPVDGGPAAPGATAEVRE